MGLLVGSVGGAQQPITFPIFVIWIVSPNHLIVLAIHDFDIWLNSSASVPRNRMHDYAEELLDDRSLDLSL